jgi:hypothetical protein
LSIAGIEPEAKFDGHSLVPYLEQSTPPSNRDLLFLVVGTSV